ncbi:MAG: transcriptional repressor [Acetobacter sp.]
MPSTSQHATPGADVYGFSARTRQQLDYATRLCANQGGRMTPQRRDVLGLILRASTPVGAYDLLEQLKHASGRPAPPTVYRALDFLLEHGLIHRIERLSAFVPCTHLLHDAPDSAADCCDHDTTGHSHAGHCQHAAQPMDPAQAASMHTAQFLICSACGAVTEIANATAILDLLRTICQDKSFTMHSASVEVEGLCAQCAATARNTLPHDAAKEHDR